MAALVIFARAADWHGRYLATHLAITAAALGDEVHLALSGDALRSLVDGQWGADDPAPASDVRLPSLADTLSEARRDLAVRVVACDTAARVVGLDPAQIVPPLDGIVSLPSLWRIAQGGRSVSV